MEAKPVVVGIDGSAQSLQAIEWAAREAAFRGHGLRIVSVPALPPRMAWQRGARPPGPDAVADVIRQTSQQALAVAADRAAELQPGLSVRTGLLTGAPAAALVEAASGAAILVLGSRGAGGFSAMLLGSVSRFAAMHSPCPVVVTREETMAVHRKVVVGVRDFDQPAALAFAFEEARLRRAVLEVLFAWYWAGPAPDLAGSGLAVTGSPGAGSAGAGSAGTGLTGSGLAAVRWPAAGTTAATAQAGAWLADQLSRWQQNYPGVELRPHVVHAQAGRVLAAASAHADLLVLGRRSAAQSALPGAGAVIHAALSHAHGPVAIFPTRR